MVAWGARAPLSDDLLVGVIEFARKTWRDDGAEGEAVHRLCDALESKTNRERARHWAEADELAPLRARMAKGRAKYPDGCTLLSLADEVGEVMHAANKGEGVERVRDELLDAAGVAMRLYLGEVDSGRALVGLEQVRPGTRPAFACILCGDAYDPCGGDPCGGGVRHEWQPVPARAGTEPRTR